jgi:hypothetical protein
MTPIRAASTQPCLIRKSTPVKMSVVGREQE